MVNAEIFSSQFIYVFASVGIAIVYLVIFSNFILRSRPEREKGFLEAREKFIKEIENRLALDGISSVEDVHSIRRLVLSDTRSHRFASTPTEELLQFHLSAIASEIGVSNDYDELRARFSAIKGLMTDSSSNERFSYLPPRDAATAMQIMDSLADKDTDSSERYLLVLAESLGSQLRQATSQARFRLGMSIVGAVASLSGLIVATVSVIITR